MSDYFERRVARYAGRGEYAQPLTTNLLAQPYGRPDADRVTAQWDGAQQRQPTALPTASTAVPDPERQVAERGAALSAAAFRQTEADIAPAAPAGDASAPELAPLDAPTDLSRTTASALPAAALREQRLVADIAAPAQGGDATVPASALDGSPELSRTGTPGSPAAPPATATAMGEHRPPPAAGSAVSEPETPQGSEDEPSPTANPGPRRTLIVEEMSPAPVDRPGSGRSSVAVDPQRPVQADEHDRNDARPSANTPAPSAMGGADLGTSAPPGPTVEQTGRPQAPVADEPSRDPAPASDGVDVPPRRQDRTATVEVYDQATQASSDRPVPATDADPAIARELDERRQARRDEAPAARADGGKTIAAPGPSPGAGEDPTTDPGQTALSKPVAEPGPRTMPLGREEPLLSAPDPAASSTLAGHAASDEQPSSTDRFDDGPPSSDRPEAERLSPSPSRKGDETHRTIDGTQPAIATPPPTSSPASAEAPPALRESTPDGAGEFAEPPVADTAAPDVGRTGDASPDRPELADRSPDAEIDRLLGPQAPPSGDRPPTRARETAPVRDPHSAIIAAPRAPEAEPDRLERHRPLESDRVENTPHRLDGPAVPTSAPPPDDGRHRPSGEVGVAQASPRDPPSEVSLSETDAQRGPSPAASRTPEPHALDSREAFEPAVTAASSPDGDQHRLHYNAEVAVEAAPSRQAASTADPYAEGPISRSAPAALPPLHYAPPIAGEPVIQMRAAAPPTMASPAGPLAPDQGPAVGPPTHASEQQTATPAPSSIAAEPAALQFASSDPAFEASGPTVPQAGATADSSAPSAPPQFEPRLGDVEAAMGRAADGRPLSDFASPPADKGRDGATVESDRDAPSPKPARPSTTTSHAASTAQPSRASTPTEPRPGSTTTDGRALSPLSARTGDSLASPELPIEGRGSIADTAADIERPPTESDVSAVRQRRDAAPSMAQTAGEPPAVSPPTSPTFAALETASVPDIAPHGAPPALAPTTDPLPRHRVGRIDAIATSSGHQAAPPRPNQPVPTETSIASSSSDPARSPTARPAPEVTVSGDTHRPATAGSPGRNLLPASAGQNSPERRTTEDAAGHIGRILDDEPVAESSRSATPRPLPETTASPDVAQPVTADARAAAPRHNLPPLPSDQSYPERSQAGDMDRRIDRALDGERPVETPAPKPPSVTDPDRIAPALPEQTSTRADDRTRHDIAGPVSIPSAPPRPASTPTASDGVAAALLRDNGASSPRIERLGALTSDRAALIETPPRLPSDVPWADHRRPQAPTADRPSPSPADDAPSPLRGRPAFAADRPAVEHRDETARDTPSGERPATAQADTALVSPRPPAERMEDRPQGHVLPTARPSVDQLSHQAAPPMRTPSPASLAELPRDTPAKPPLAGAPPIPERMSAAAPFNPIPKASMAGQDSTTRAMATISDAAATPAPASPTHSQSAPQSTRQPEPVRPLRAEVMLSPTPEPAAPTVKPRGRRRAAGRVEAPAGLHLRIHRIDVHAPVAAPRAVQTPAARDTALSLDDYLKRRKDR